MLIMWPFDRLFRKKANPDYSRLAEEDKELLSQEDLEKEDSEFRDESGFIVTKLLKKKKKL